MATLLTSNDAFVPSVLAAIAGASTGAMICIELSSGTYWSGTVGTISVPPGVHLRILGPTNGSPAELRMNLQSGTGLRVELGSGATLEWARVDVVNVNDWGAGSVLQVTTPLDGTARIDSSHLERHTAFSPSALLRLTGGGRVELQNLLLQTNRTAVRSDLGVALSVRDTAFEGCQTGIHSPGVETLDVDNCWFQACGVGVRLQHDVQSPPTITSVTDSRFQRCEVGILSRVELPGSAGISGTTSETSSDPHALDVERCRFAADGSGRGVVIEAPAPRTAAAAWTRVVSSVFDGLVAGVVVRTSRPDPILLSHNTFLACRVAGIDLSGVGPFAGFLTRNVGSDAGTSVQVAAPVTLGINNVHIVEPVDRFAANPRGGVFLPSWLGNIQQPDLPVGTQSFTPIVLGRCLFYSERSWEPLSETVRRVFVSGPGSAPGTFTDIFVTHGWRHTGTDWENPYSLLSNSLVFSDAPTVDPALARTSGSDIDVHPTRIGSSAAFAGASRPDL